MPELPEVETVMRGLSARLLGRTIVHAQTHRAGMRWPFPPGLAARIEGSRVESFRRRAKYLLMRLSARDGVADSVLIHLGMSGRMNIAAAGQNDIPRHEHLTMQTDDGWRVGFVDPRRFGSVDLVPTLAEDSHRLLAALGPEPLEGGLTAKHLTARFAGRATPIKAALLDQANVAGLGNIYVCEALFRAGIHPERLAGEVDAAAIERLVREIKATLTEAIAAGGSTLRDYAQPDGELGYFQHAFKVYGRTGERCERCTHCPGILRIVQSGRSTFYCPATQR